jgi:hypothetical protein
MARHFKLLAVFSLATVLFPTGSAFGQGDVTKKPYVLTGQEAILAGTIRFKGKPPKPEEIDMSADPVCYRNDPRLNYSARTEWFEVRNGRIANVLVYVTSEAFTEYTFELPRAAAVLAHINCRYQPHVLGIRLGQPLRIVNADRTHHNTHLNPVRNREWNLSQPPSWPPIVTRIQHPEVAIPFKDNLHPWQRAYVSVFTHPFFAITGVDGSFRIEGLPPGSYKLTAWQEEMREKTIDVVMAAGETKNIDFSFDKSDAKPYSRVTW